MKYTIYKITNLTNGKYYIGKHKTNNLDDGYMGSGKLIQRAIKKHGVENFRKEILHVFDNEADMNSKEKDLVVISEDTYNLCPGGHGGFGFINSKGLNYKGFKSVSIRNKEISPFSHPEKYGREKVQEWRRAGSGEQPWQRLCRWQIENSEQVRYQNEILSQRALSQSSKKKRIGTFEKIKHQQGERNSQYGSMWITNGIKNKKISKNDTIPNGWKKGRKIKN